MKMLIFKVQKCVFSVGGSTDGQKPPLLPPETHSCRPRKAPCNEPLRSENSVLFGLYYAIQSLMNPLYPFRFSDT